MDEQISPQGIVDKAKLAYQNGEYAEAAQYFSEAVKAYMGMNDALMAAEMQNNLKRHLKRFNKLMAFLQNLVTEDIRGWHWRTRRQHYSLLNDLKRQ